MYSDEESKGKADKNLREEFSEILEEGEEVGEDIAELGRRHTEEGQRMSDLARSTLSVLDEIPDDYPLYGAEDAIEDWRVYVSVGRENRDRISEFNAGTVASTSSSASFASSDLFENVIQVLPEDVKPRVTVAIRGFHEVVERSTNKNKVIALMEGLGLNERFHEDRRSAAEQFETAYDAMNRPVSGASDPANTSLIPMREAIQAAVDHLLLLRPVRSNVPKMEGLNKDSRKIIAVGEQLKRADLPTTQVQSWAKDWDKLKNQYLSPGKTEPIDREEWRKRINRATLFLIGFLSGLDPDKLRKS